MKKNNIFQELDNQQVEEILKYSTHYSDASLANIKNRINRELAQESQTNKKIKVSKVLIATAAAIALLGTVMVHAENISFKDLFQMVFGDKFDYILPYGDNLYDSAYDDGLELKLLAAYRDNTDITMFYTLTDTTEDRMAGDFRVSGDFNIQSSGGGSKLLEYDTSTKTATYMKESNELALSNQEEITFSINHLQFGWEEFSILEKEIDMELLLNNHIPTVKSEKETDFSAGGSALDDLGDHKNGISLLETDELNIPINNTNWTYISNIGFVEGKLHIQTKRPNKTDNRINRIYFVDENGQEIYGDYDRDKVLSISHVRNEINEDGIYNEFLFYSIKEPSQLKDLTLKIEGIKYAQTIDDPNLTVTFKIPEQIPNIKIPTDKEITIIGETVENGTIVLSPLYLKFYYETTNFIFANTSDAVYLKYRDGREIPLEIDTSEKHLKEDEDIYQTVIRFSNGIIEIEEVESIHINGQEFFLP